MITDEVLKQLRLDYIHGTRIKLIQMDDKEAPPVGTEGTVDGVDDVGRILVHWDNGSRISVIYGEDVIEKVFEHDGQPRKQGM